MSTVKSLAAETVNHLPQPVRIRVKGLYYARKLRRSDADDEPELTVLPHLVKPGDHVVDIGANIGLYTKTLSALVGPRGLVHAIEPVPETYAVLTSNVQRLSLGNVRTYPYAVTNHAGLELMGVPRYENGVQNFYRAQVVGRERDNLRVLEVPAIRLDALLEDAARIAFVKCDVESHEWKVLEGARGFVNAHSPAWMIEVSGDRRRAGSDAGRVFDFMEGRGYRPFVFAGRRLRPMREDDRPVNVFFLTQAHIGRLVRTGVLNQRSAPPVPGLVSVVVTCFNYSRFVRKAVDSALRQSYRSVEVIVVDDGSTDETPAVMAAYRRDARVRYVRQTNQGHAAAKNTGIRLARGEFVAFLDADDVWDLEKLALQIPRFGDRDTGMVYSAKRLIGPDGEEVPAAELPKRLLPKRGAVTEHLLYDNFVPFSSAVVRRDILDRAGWMDETITMGCDWELWLRLSRVTSFEFTERPLLLYRIGHGQMSQRVVAAQRCADDILRRFLAVHQKPYSDRFARRLWAQTHRNRGYFFRNVDLALSNSHYRRAIVLEPWNVAAYRGRTKNALLALLRTRANATS